MNNEEKYCPSGHEWIEVPISLLFSKCYYCEKCDKIYQPTVREISKERFKEHFNTDRFNDIKELALFLDARSKVKKSDLIKLGLLKDDSKNSS